MVPLIWLSSIDQWLSCGVIKTALDMQGEPLALLLLLEIESEGVGGTKKKSVQSEAIIVGDDGVGRPWDCLNCSIEKLVLGVGTCNVGLRCVFTDFDDPISAEGYDDGSELPRTGVDG
jgi:hypothetical protein